MRRTIRLRWLAIGPAAVAMSLAAAHAKAPKTPELGAPLPPLVELLEAAGWTPSPELSGVFQPGRVFFPQGAAHVLAVADCIAGPPVRSTYTGMELVTQLQGGVGVRLGAGGVEAHAGLTKSLKFGAPVHIAVPLTALAPTPACRAALASGAPAGAYIIREALEADIAEQTCGRIDAAGRFAVLGQAEASLAQSCAQVSLEPVIIAVRTVAVEQLLTAPTTATPSAPPTTTPATEPQGDGYLAALSAEAAALVEARAQLEQHQRDVGAALDEAEGALRSEASAAFAAASAAVDADPLAGAALLEGFVARYADATVEVRVAGQPAARAVVVPELDAARARLRPPNAAQPRPGTALLPTGMRMVQAQVGSTTIEVSDSEVTQRAYQAIIGVNPARHDRCGGDCPVERVSWSEAVAFCNTLSEAEGLRPAYSDSGPAARRVPDANGYRLLTWAEWLTLAGKGAAYAGGDSVRDVAWTNLNSESSPHPVKMLRGTPIGVYDLSGNVAEWLEDGDAAERGIAGGAWSGPAMEAGIGARRAERTGYRGEDVGLRIARTLAAPK